MIIGNTCTLYNRMITKIKIINTSISNVQVYNTKLSTAVIKLYIRSSELTLFKTESISSLLLPPRPCQPPFYSVSMKFAFSPSDLFYFK